MTLRIRLNLECDHCGNPYPSCGVCPAPLDGAVFSPAEVRRQAKAEGWTQRSFHGVRRDLCPRCTKKAKKDGAK